MRALVTGTSGFVGGALGGYLRRRGWHVTGVSRRPARPGAVDVSLPHDLSRSPPPVRDAPDVVVHAAALSSPWGPPAAFERANVAGTRHVLDLARRHPGTHLVLISSSSVLYREGDQLGVREDEPPPPRAVNAYAQTKLRAEELVRGHTGPWTILRPRAVYGVGDTVLFPRLARAARLRLLPHLTRADGVEPVGDLVSIDNLVRLAARAIEGRATGTLHLTDGAPVPIRAFVDDALAGVGLPGASFRVGVPAAMRLAGVLEGLSRRTGWWEPPLTRYGVSVFARSKTFDTARAVAALGAPDVPTDVALRRFTAWWRAGASLDDPAMGRVGEPA